MVKEHSTAIYIGFHSPSQHPSIFKKILRGYGGKGGGVGKFGIVPNIQRCLIRGSFMAACGSRDVFIPEGHSWQPVGHLMLSEA